MASNELYLNNPLIKRAYVDIEWTKEQILEYKKCSEDVNYFIKKYVKIINLDRGLINFEMYPYQENMATTICDNRFTIIKSCRQSGKCVKSETVINIRNKKTGEIVQTTIGQFHEMTKKASRDAGTSTSTISTQEIQHEKSNRNLSTNP